MSDRESEEREMVSLSVEEARVLYHLATDAIADHEFSSDVRMATLCGRLAAVIVAEDLDAEIVGERNE